MTVTEQDMERKIWMLERHVRHMEYVFLRMQLDSSIYMGICVNSKCETGHAIHPHWMHPPEVDMTRDIIHI